MYNEKNILISDDLRTQIQHYYYHKELKILFSKDQCGKETKYEYDEEGGYKVFEQNANGEFVSVLSVSHEDEDEAIIMADSDSIVDLV
ncbi:MAG: hypothetical protein ACI4NB_11840 [Candidatus Ornithospirochaeta sp.]